MSTYDNFFDVQNLLTPDIVQKTSEAIGQSVEKTKDGLKSTVTAFIKGLLDKGSTQEGADIVVNMVNTHNFESNDVVNSILGNDLDSTVSKLSSTTGLNQSSVKKIMGLVAPVVMGTIGSKVKKEKMNSAGLMKFFDQQKKIITNVGFESKSSEYYNLSGEDPLKDSRNVLLQRNFPWKVVFFTVGFLLLVMWFWWNIVQIESPTLR